MQGSRNKQGSHYGGEEHHTGVPEEPGHEREPKRHDQPPGPGESRRQKAGPGQFLDTSRGNVEAGKRAEKWEEEVPHSETVEAQRQSAECENDPDHELVHGCLAPPPCRTARAAMVVEATGYPGSCRRIIPWHSLRPALNAFGTV